MKNLKFLSELMDVKGAVDSDRIEDMVFEDCKVDRGLHIEAYYNPDGVYNEDESSDGGSIFIFVDQPISYFKLIDVICTDTGCNLKDDEVTFRIVNDDVEIADLEFVNATDLLEIKSVVDLVNLKETIESVNKVIAMQYLRHFPDSAGVEIGAVIDDRISLDQDLEDFLISVNFSMNGIVKKNDKTYAYTSVDGMEDSDYIFLYDGQNGCYVPFTDLPNRHDEDLGDETFIDFNKCILLDKEILDKCDDCGKVVPRDLLFNLNPENNEDLKEEHQEHDGMVCEYCYNKMKK